jgi:uncharacterized membrane protein
VKSVLFLLLSAAVAFPPLIANAQTSPLANRIIVQQAVQNQLQNQLNAQTRQLQGEQNISNANLQMQLLRETTLTQSSQIQQQLNLMNLQRQLNSIRLQAHPGPQPPKPPGIPI